MGSRKRRRERDSSSRKHRRHSRSGSRSISRSRSRSRSRSPKDAPPPPSLSSTRDSERDRDRRQRKHKDHREHKRKHHSRERSPSTRQRPRERQESSRHERDYRSDSKFNSISFHSNSCDVLLLRFVGSDVVEVPIAPPAPVISKTNRSPSPIPENGAGDSLSIAETNKLRAKLGLKPLEMDSGESSSAKPSADGLSTYKDEWGEFSHKPAENLAEKLQAAKIRDKIRAHKEKRAIEGKLKSQKTLGEEDDVDNTLNWIERSREKERMKQEAERRAKALEEMDNELIEGGASAVGRKKKKHSQYSDKQLKGLRVDHDMDSFQEGRTVILTLKDRDVLDDDNGDTLVNVNMIDDERYRKNVENKKLNPNQYGYDVYQDEFDQFGQPIERNVLSKYDEETESGKKTAFRIGENIAEEREQRRKLLEVISEANICLV